MAFYLYIDVDVETQILKKFDTRSELDEYLADPEYDLSHALLIEGTEIELPL